MAKNIRDKSEIKAKEKFILSITENGYGKKTSHLDYRVTNRGGKGIIGILIHLEMEIFHLPVN